MKSKVRLHHNVWGLSLTSFLTDISSEMIVNLLPLFMLNVLGIKMVLIGLIEGVAEALSSLFKILSGWLADRFKSKKKLTVAGYTISALAKPIYFFASSWGLVALARWLDRFGKGIRTAPRDALLADSTDHNHRGLAFGLHRAADTAGAFVGLFIALLVILSVQSNKLLLQAGTFRLIVLLSLIPAFGAVVVLILLTREVKRDEPKVKEKSGKKLPGKFWLLLGIVTIFELGNSSDAFIILRAQERGLSLTGIIIMLIAFNLVYTIVSTPAGRLSDRIERKKVVLAGWFFYALVYFGFALAKEYKTIFVLYVLYGIYYGLTYGTARALIADIVPIESRGIAFGIFNALLGITDFPASLIAGLLWGGAGNWPGFGPAAPFYFGATCALLAAILLFIWKTPDARKN